MNTPTPSEINLLAAVERGVIAVTTRLRQSEQRRTELQEKLAKLRAENQQLQSRVTTLEQKLSLATLSQFTGGETEEAERGADLSALSSLEAELKEILATVDECVALLDKRLSNGVKN